MTFVALSPKIANLMVIVRRSDIVFFFALALGLYLAYLARDVLVLIYVSALFAVVVNPAVSLVRKIRIGKWHPGRGLAIMVIILGGALLMTSFVLFVLPPVFRDTQGLAGDWPKRATALYERIRNLPMADRFDPATLQEHTATALGGLVGVFKGIAGGLLWFFSWLILTAYFIIDGEHAFNWFISLFPARTRVRLEATLLRAEGRVRHWLIGQIALMVILGISSGVVFGLLHIKYFYALAVFAGAANIVPILGPIASVALAGIVAAFDSWTKLAGVLIFYFVYQQIENAFLTPRIMKASVDLPPLAIIIALSLGGSLAGLIGAMVAVPTAALVAVFVDEYLVRPNHDQVGFAKSGVEDS